MSTADVATTTMHFANPVFIPRNHRIEEVILAAKERDFAPFNPEAYISGLLS